MIYMDRIGEEVAKGASSASNGISNWANHSAEWFKDQFRDHGSLGRHLVIANLAFILISDIGTKILVIKFPDMVREYRRLVHVAIYAVQTVLYAHLVSLPLQATTVGLISAATYATVMLVRNVFARHIPVRKKQRIS